MDNQSLNIEHFEAWRTKVFNFSLSDQMGTLVSRALELMMGVIINGDNVSNTEHFVRSLESEHKLAHERDPQSNVPIREVVYILCAGLGITIDSIIKSRINGDLDRDETQVDSSLADQNGNSNEESDSYVFDIENPLAELGILKEEPIYIDDESDNVNILPNLSKIEETGPHVEYSGDDGFDDPSDEIKEEEEEFLETPSSGMQITILAAADEYGAPAAAAALSTPQPVGTSAARPKRAAAAAAAARMVDGDTPVVKRAKTDGTVAAAAENTNNCDLPENRARVEDSGTGLHCPICTNVCKSTHALILHLKRAHETSPKKMGIVFLCPCGHETISNYHAKEDKCGRSKFTSIINARDSKFYKTNDSTEESDDEDEQEEEPAAAAAAAVPSPLPAAPSAARPKRAAAAADAARMEECDTPFPKKAKTDDNAEKTLQCPMCEKTCTNAPAVIMHLRYAHNSTPKKAEIVFRCDCGNESQSNNHAAHDPCGLAKSIVIISSKKSKRYSIVGGIRIGDSNEVNKDLHSPDCESPQRVVAKSSKGDVEKAAAANIAANAADDGPTASHSRCWCTACGQDFQDPVNLLNHVSLAHPNNDSNICAFDDMNAHFGTD